MPVEPWLRCDTDTPWVARRPPKFQRFIEPAKPLPMVMPTTSTNWPGTKWLFLVFGLARRFGWHALSISMVPYVMVHFGKPPAETLGAMTKVKHARTG